MLIAMDDNLDWYPHAFIMSDSKWDPSIVEKEYIYDNNDPDDALLLCLQDGHDLWIDAYRTTFHYDNDSDNSQDSPMETMKHEHLVNP